MKASICFNFRETVFYIPPLFLFFSPDKKLNSFHFSESQMTSIFQFSNFENFINSQRNNDVFMVPSPLHHSILSYGYIICSCPVWIYLKVSKNSDGNRIKKDGSKIHVGKIIFRPKRLSFISLFFLLFDSLCVRMKTN